MNQQFLYSLAWIIIIAAMLLSFYAQSKVGRVYNQYFQIKNHKEITGKEVARQMLDRYGLYDVSIRVIPGYLTDNYDPKSKVMSLSEEVCNGNSICPARGGVCEMNLVAHNIALVRPYRSLGIKGCWIRFII